MSSGITLEICRKLFQLQYILGGTRWRFFYSSSAIADYVQGFSAIAAYVQGSSAIAAYVQGSSAIAAYVQGSFAIAA